MSSSLFYDCYAPYESYPSTIHVDGDKSKEELYIIVDNVVKYLISCGCVAIVIACNTASAICVKKLREEQLIMGFTKE